MNANEPVVKSAKQPKAPPPQKYVVIHEECVEIIGTLDEIITYLEDEDYDDDYIMEMEVYPLAGTMQRIAIQRTITLTD